MGIAQSRRALGSLRTQAGPHTGLEPPTPGLLTALPRAKPSMPARCLLLLPFSLWLSPVDSAASLVPHDFGLATHDSLECPGTKDNQISSPSGQPPFVSFEACSAEPKP